MSIEPSLQRRAQCATYFSNLRALEALVSDRSLFHAEISNLEIFAKADNETIGQLKRNSNTWQWVQPQVEKLGTTVAALERQVE